MNDNEMRIAKMANRVAEEDSGDAGDAGDAGEALKNVDEAIDNIVAALIVLDENLPLVKPESVPQQAALDLMIETLNEAVKPYMADVVKAADLFG